MFGALVFASCSTSRRTQLQGDYEKALADTVLAYALDHEALYTLADTLKPISSVKFLRYAVAKDSTHKDGDANIVSADSLLHSLERYQKVCNALSSGDWQFVLTPFKRTDKNTRNLEIYVVRRSVFAKKLEQYKSFFGQWGFSASSNPAVVLAVVEYESALDRNRAYGYLFGYPSYAVDFFVNAQRAQEKDTTRKIVPRDFFAIPVYAGTQGYYTYAMPKGQQPTAVDSTIYYKAAATLERYKVVREKYKTPTGVQARKLWAAMRKRQRF